MLIPVVEAVLSGAVFEDHCSPVSDTTTISFVASTCDHIAHVKTQSPYAITTVFVAIICDFIPAGFGISPLISLLRGIVLLFIIINVFGATSF